MRNKRTGSLKIKIAFIFSILIAIAFSLNWMVAVHTTYSEKVEDLEKVLEHLLIESTDEYIVSPLTPKSDLAFLYTVPHNRMILNDSEASGLRFVVSRTPYVTREGRIAAFVRLDNGMYLNAISDDQKINAAIGKYGKKLLIRYLVSLLVILMISLFLLDHYMKPLAVLAQKTHDWKTGDPFDFSPDNPDREIEEVSSAFGTLIRRLEAYRAKEAELFKEAAHELKTPLALMRSRLDVYENSHDYDKRKFVGDLGHDIERLTTELKNVLFLESSDFEEPVSVHINAALKKIVSKVEILAQRKQLTLQLPAHDFTVIVAEKLLNKVLVALIENAMTYALEGSQIAIAIDPIRRTLSVSNDIGGEKYLFSSRIGQKMLKRISEELHFNYEIIHEETKYTIRLIFAGRQI